MLVSVIIRTLNEALYLGELLKSIDSQIKDSFDLEIVIIDSGSTDGTLNIAQNHGCKITFIKKEKFSFGRSLNMGSEFSKGDILVYISGHCIPTDNTWLKNLIQPIIDGVSDYSYGCQKGRDTTKYSELQLFKANFPNESKVPQHGIFCNNANSAISRKVWSNFKFNEQITGLEDMELAKRYCENGGKISYISNACVYHIHNEGWLQTKRRYERESLALREILPEIHINIIDLIRYVCLSIFNDCKAAQSEKSLLNNFIDIIMFRIAQYYGSYLGNKKHRVLSKKQMDNYFYPSSR